MPTGWTAMLVVFKWPVIVVGGLGAIGMVANAFGFGLTTPGSRVTTYVAEHAIEHEAAGDVHAVEHKTINDTLTEIDTHLEVQQSLLEAVVRGECIENPRENLERQGLIQKCRELGIER